ncbi:zona pellucida sperm-binding protein 3-like [Xyrauchen texanus]|uniref:zona pellucida sperm-binding protein 3-like n=1 Tax=Xyrauchen texanus TaxID=154827 RepID=UPI0022422BBC|nr:zona pellucida sperm-binding protein 3-like [Xyrauchen texanus]
MWVNVIFVVVLLNMKNLVDTSPFEADAEKEWLSVKKIKPNYSVRPQFKEGSLNSPSRFLELPEWVRTEASEVYYDFFKPEMGVRLVPEEVKSILLPEKPAPKRPSSMTKKMVQVLCYLDRMYVRVLKTVFTNPQAWKYLTLGSCPVNNVTTSHYYFRCPLTGCGMNRREDDDRVIYSNTLCYKPPNSGLVVWELPYSLPIHCRYTKFHHSYQVGFLPKVMSETLYRGLQTGGLQTREVTLTAMNASWDILSADQSVVIGQPICFEAQSPKSGESERLYLNHCFVTSSNIPPMDKYVVVDNYGCLVDSKNNTLAKFYNTTEKSTVRMCFQTFMFKDMVSNHSQFDQSCNQSGSQPDSDQPSYGWLELYGDPSVCDCCDSTCEAPATSNYKSRSVSKAWDVIMSEDLPTPLPATTVSTDTSASPSDLPWDYDYY